MAIGTPAQKRESYRERLYRAYLTNLQGADLVEVHERLQGAYPYFKRLLKHFPESKDARILELGCGYGVWLYWLKEAGYRCLEGVDRSPEQVKSARTLGLDFVKLEDIAVHLAERKPESCDVVLAADVFEHFAKEEALSFADEVFRVLAPGGVLILHLPNGAGIFSGCVAYGDFTHEIIVTRNSLGQLLRCAGFSQICAFEDTPVIHGFLSACRSLVWLVARTIARVIYAAETGSTGRELILTQNFLAVARKP